MIYTVDSKTPLLNNWGLFLSFFPLYFVFFDINAYFF